jgi:DNA transposition AAA+ family ATPase
MGEDYKTYDDLLERLQGDARMNPIPDRLMDVTTTEALEEVRNLVNHAVHEGLTTQADLARRTNFKSTAISNFCTSQWGKRRAALQLTLASNLAKTINQILREREAKTTEVGGFIPIRLTEAIFAIAQYAVKRRKIAAFVVPAGCCKSMALQAFEQEIPGSILVTVKRARATPKSFLQLWARRLGLNETGRTEDIQDRIISELATSHRLVLIDEAHKLTVAAIDAMREIWDEAQMPVVLAGTPSLYRTLTSQRVGTYGSELMDQLYSRVCMYRDLTTLEEPSTGTFEQRFTVDDLRKIYARGHVRIAADGLKFLCKIANSPGTGGLRTCTALVQMAIDCWAGELVTAAILRGALQMRLGIKEAGFFDTREEPQPEVAATA